jgi:hypothetical protein
MLVTFRYSLGVPLNRLAHLQNNLGIPAPASTQWEVARDRLPAVEPVFDELIDIAADGRILHNDDTSMPVLELMGKRREELLEQGVLENPDRTGLFTTAVVSAVDHRLVALFFTGRKHAGENLARVLDQRDPDLPPPIHMCDGLDRNRSSKHEVVECNCTAHGRRHIVDEVNNFPAECRHALEQFALVFKHEEFCKENGLTAKRGCASTKSTVRVRRS